VETRSFVKTASGAVGIFDGAPAGAARHTHERRMAILASTLRTTDGRSIAPDVLVGPPTGGIAFAHVEGRSLTQVLETGPHALQRRAVRRLAAAVAALHTTTVPPELPAAPAIAPSPLDLTPDGLRWLSAAAAAVYRDVGDAETAALWARPAYDRAAALVHNDLRAVNVLVADNGDTMVIDWEFAGRGAPVRDVGTVLADLVQHALSATWTARLTSGTPIMEPLAALFASEYSIRAGGLPDARAVEAALAGALFHTAVARAQRDHHYHPVDRAAMGVVRRLAHRPGRLWHLLGGGLG
jgi:aminoglycoside phosphotransferase (APT) family kinase protein